jgi:hypothetical protein
VSDVLGWALAYLHAHFPMDARERMLASGEGSVPRFAMIRTPQGCIWRFRCDVIPDQIRALAKYAAREPAISDPVGSPPPERLEPMRRVFGDEVETTRLWLYAPAMDGPNATGLGSSVPPPACTPAEAVAFLAAQGHGAIEWRNREALSVAEKREIRVYGDLFLLR